MSDNAAAIVPVTSLSTTSRDQLLGQLIPQHVSHAFGRKTYQFLRANGKTVEQLRWDRSLPRESATLIFVDGAKTFTLIYRPLAEGEQVVRDLPLEELANAVNSLVEAGFPHRKIAVKLEAPEPASNALALPPPSLSTPP